MSRNKQIEEMAKVLCEDCAKDVAPCVLNRTGRRCDAVMEQAEALYNAGYRKASEVAEEIFGEIEELIKPNGAYLWRWDLNRLAELKKKYTEEGKWQN